MKINKLLLFYFTLILCCKAQAQFVDITQTEPFANPASVCAGGVLTFRLNNLQNLNSGSIISMELSTATGSFPGTLLTTIEHSTDNINWTAGNYIWTANIANSYIRVNIPVTATPGTAYTARAVSSSPSMSGGNNNGSITITPPITTIPTVPSNTFGTNDWFGHVYSWQPTGSGLLNTPALVAAQNFFSPINYKGHVVKNNLSFDDNFGSTGFLGSTSFYNQTSIGCGNNMSNNFAIRYLRTQNFAPGRYSISIQADDGMRLSIDGGTTWLLNSFIEQQYIQSLQTTNTLNPTGICLSGNVNLVVEYFQRPAQARATVTITLLQSTINTPANQNICVGQNTSFDATCTEVGATYQWQSFDSLTLTWNNIINNATYSGANGPILSITAATASMDNTPYQCLVTNSCPSAIPSATAILTVSGSSDSFTTQPIDMSVCANANATLQAQFSNSAASYQWLMSTDGGLSFSNVVANTNFSNQASASMNINSIPASFSGYQFFCSATNSCGGIVNSDTILLSVNTTNPVISSQPSPSTNTLCNGQSAQFSIGVTATQIFWQYSSDGGITFQDINTLPGFNGVNTDTLTINPVTINMNNWIFRCRLPDCTSNLFSNTATILVSPSQVINTQPSIAQTVCIGDNVSLSVGASNATAYQWFAIAQGITAAITNNTQFSGSSSSTLSINNVQLLLNGVQIYCKVSGTCASGIYSDTLTINIPIAPTFSQPSNANSCVGLNASFTVGAANTTCTYQWFASNDFGVTYTAVTNAGQFSGANTATLNVNSISQLNDSIYFYCLITDACANTYTSNSAVLIVNAGNLGFGFQPTPRVTCEGQSASFTCTSNSANTFQWQVSVNGTFVNISNGSNYSGVFTNALTISNVPLSFDGNIYRCQISLCGNSVNSIDAQLTVKPKASITKQPKDINLCAYEVGQVALTAKGNGLTYQWQIESSAVGVFSNIALSNSMFYGINGPTVEVTANVILQGKRIRCLVSDSCGSVISTAITIKINQAPRIQVQPVSQSTCEDKDVYFAIDAVGDSLEYEWYYRVDSNANFIKVLGSDLPYDSATSRIMLIRSVKLDYDGFEFYCSIPSCVNAIRSDTVRLKVRNKVIPVFIPTCFTPNGDGLNEVLEFVGIKDSEIEGNIYDRWGEKLFSFSKNDPIWDGRYLTRKVQTGSYPYVITNTGKGCSDIVKHGVINVIR